MDANVATAISPAAAKNDNRLARLKKDVKELGANKAKGEDALPMLGFKICSAVADGIITMDKKDPNYRTKSTIAEADGKFPLVDWAQYLYELYVTEETNVAVHERSAKSFEIQVSKVRRFALLGALDTSVIGTEVLSLAQTVYTDALKVRVEGDERKPRSAFDFYIEVCRAQLHKDHRDVMLTEEEMAAFVWKKEGEVKATTIEGTIQRAIDILEMLYTDGIECKVTGDKVTDDDQRVKDAIDMLKERVEEIVNAAKVEELQAQLATLLAKKK